ncbi:MAG: pseudouridine synthase [Pseudomonadota bacterium]
MSSEDNRERIAKVMARAGLCSRREAERWIEDGRVSVDGHILTTPAYLVDGSEEIIVDGKALPKKERTRLFLYHKPAGLVTTHKDEKDRKTIFDSFPQGLPRLISVGRLDMNTEGLLLLTNDGALSRYLELPETGLKRTYRVRVHGKVIPEKLSQLKKSVRIDGVRYGSIDAKLEPKKEHQGANSWIEVSLKEGKNREVRKVMDHIGLTVNRLIRTSYGPFHLGNLERGVILEVKFDQIKSQIPEFFKS